MANLLKKKFIGNDQIDGSKILLEVGQTLRLKDGIGGEIDVIQGIESQISAEEAARIAADSTLQTNINTEVSDRAAAIVGVQAFIDAEAATREAADLTLAANLALEVDARQMLDASVTAAISSEIANRNQGDLDLQALISAENFRAMNAEALLIPLNQKGAVNGVASLDENGLVPATQLPSYVDDVLEFADLATFPVTGETGKIYVAIDTSKCYRWSGSTYIYITSGAVDSVNGKNGAVTLNASEINMVDGVTSVESKLNSLQGEVDALDAASSGDLSALQARVTVTESDITALEAADGVLQTNINAANAAITAEEAARIAADSALDVRLDAIEASGWAKKKVVVVSQTITDGYIDLDHVAKANTISGFVDRLAIHEGAAEDYTISEVAGKTRITFVNSLVNPGSEALGNGDNLYFKYQY